MGLSGGGTHLGLSWSSTARSSVHGQKTTIASEPDDHVSSTTSAKLPGGPTLSVAQQQPSSKGADGAQPSGIGTS